MQAHATLDRLSDDELLRRLDELVSHSRRVEADLVAHIGEVERRRLYAREASPSMFAYCRERLHLSEAEAYMRIRVARAARRHAVLLDMLRDGRLHLSGIVRLLPVLTRENRDVLLARATHGSKRQILELVAELSPRPDVPARVRKLPRQRYALLQPAALEASSPVASLRTSLSGAGLHGPGEAPATSESTEGSLVPPSRSPGGQLGLGGGNAPAARADADGQPYPIGGNGAAQLCPDTVDAALGDPPSCPTYRAVVEPLSPGRYKVQFTASAELRDKLERLQALMRSQVPDGDLAEIIDHAISQALARLEARRFAKTTAPRKGLSPTDTAPVSRHVPAAVRRTVHERDGNRCGFVDARGRRCSERDRLEFHHRHPFGMGGGHDPGNVGLLCRAHNQLVARSDYGALATGRRGKTPAAASPQ
jgi:hypothetical protein